MGIRGKMLLSFGGGAAIILVGVGLFSLLGIPFLEMQGNYQYHRSEIIRKIDILAQMKKGELVSWFQEQINHARIFSEITGFDQSRERFYKGIEQDKQKSILLEEIRHIEEYEKALLIARSILKEYTGDNEIRVVETKTGMVIFSTNEKSRGLDLSWDEGIRNAKQPGIREQVYFRKKRSTGRGSLYILYPIAAQGPIPSLVVMFVLDTEKLMASMLHEGEESERSRETILVDMNRTILSPLKYPLPGNRTAEILEYKLHTKSAEMAAWGIDGTIFYQDYRGLPAIAAVRHLRITPEFGIGLIIKIDEEEVMASTRRSLQNTIIISGMGLMFLMAIVYLLSVRITRPITQLSKTVEKIGEGDLSQRSLVTTRDEVGLLADSFNEMVAKTQEWHQDLEKKIRERTALLSESEARLRLTLDATQIGLWDWNMRDDIWYSTPIYFKMLGYDPTTEEQKREVWGERTHPDDRDFVVNKMTEVRDSGLNEFDIEFRFRHADGSYRWINSIGRAVEFDESHKPIRMLGLQIDITRRKQDEEELRIINREQHAVNRIISATATSTGVHEVLERALDEVLFLTGLEGGTVCLVTPDNTLSLAAHRGTSEETIQDLTMNVIRIGDCLCGECAMDHKPLILPDREAVLKFATREASRGEDIRFHAAFPLLVADRCLGVLCIFTRTDIKPMERSLKMLETVSLQIALSLEAAQLYEKTLEHAATLEIKIKDRTYALEENQKALMNVVEDLNVKTEELKSANIKLQDLDRLKNIFLASMSHELRTPLNSIIGFTGILLMGLTGKLNKEQENQLGMVKNSAHHLLSLINDILDISKIEAGMMEPMPEEFRFHDLVQDATRSVMVTAEEKGIDLSYTCPSDIILFSDPKRIRQIIINLLSNAVKFTEKGSVHLLVQSVTLNRKSHIRVLVTDTGIGIKKEDIYRLFSPFQQVNESLVKKFEGTGLGLYLCKKLANMLGGDITVNSEYGKGSEFVMELPLLLDQKDQT